MSRGKVCSPRFYSLRCMAASAVEEEEEKNSEGGVGEWVASGCTVA